MRAALFIVGGVAAAILLVIGWLMHNFSLITKQIFRNFYNSLSKIQH